MAKEWTNEDKAWNIVFTRLSKDGDKLTREGLKNLLVEVMDEKDKYWKKKLKDNLIDINKSCEFCPYFDIEIIKEFVDTTKGE